MAETVIMNAVCLFIGGFAGIVVMAILSINRYTDFDTERLDWLSASNCDAFKTDNGWMVVNPKGMQVGHAHKTLRSAIDFARDTE